eukprot:TRINITY_DN9206_c0_g1_i1.p2 TRINITY_DN9206_c0_g1~~TRINITY_DN9206_c0_g1_i1.p2  ORF type:complete len:113 (+),score=3.05 TRINITY_DN9206_c0_g1_i1:133-471(+)
MLRVVVFVGLLLLFQTSQQTQRRILDRILGIQEKEDPSKNFNQTCGAIKTNKCSDKSLAKLRKFMSSFVDEISRKVVLFSIDSNILMLLLNKNRRIQKMGCLLYTSPSPRDS